MRTRTLGVLLVVVLVLVPTWFAALQPSGEAGGEVEIDTTETDMRPLQSILDTPEEFTPAQVGVVIWLALGVLTVFLAVFHRFMHGMGTGGSGEGSEEAASSSWFQTEHRWIAEYLAPSATPEGLYVVFGLVLATVSFSVLAVLEFTTLARTQYIGLYVGGIFLTLAGGIAAYSAWFLPHVIVAEERYHG